MKRKCEVCGYSKNILIYHQKLILPTNYRFHNGYDVVVCEKCGFSFADNIPDQSFFDVYYQEMSKKTFYLKKQIYKNEKNSNYHKDINVRIAHSFNNIKKNLSKEDRILDVGCYTGELLNLLKKNGFDNCLGIDPSPYAIKLAKKKYNLKVKVGNVFENLDLGLFDYIIINHVLEHIKDIKLFISKIAGYLKIGGKVYIESPDAYNFFISQSTKYLDEHQEAFQQFSVEHINYFTKISLTNLMNLSGFDNIYLESQVSSVAVLTSLWQLKTLVQDDLIVSKMKQYLKDSKEVNKKIIEKINNIKKKYKQIYVWGVGVHTQKLLSLTNLGQINICAFIDSNPAYVKDKLVGKPIINPNSLKHKKNIPILISSKTYQNNIRDWIKEKGLKNEAILLYETL